MNSQPIMGIDPSLTSTGLCFGTTDDDMKTQVCSSKPIGKSVGDRIRRYEGLVGQIVRVCDQVRPQLILIEEYAYSKNTGGQMYLGEFGGILRFHLIDYTPHVIEVTASGLKKFATGKGNAPKEIVMAHVAQRYGKLFGSNDEADAFVLFQMALCLAGRQEPATGPQREAVAKITDGHTATAEQIKAFCGDLEDRPF